MAFRDDSEWLTLGQAARFLGVAQSTIRKWSDQGRVPAFYTPGGHRRYKRGDLEAFLERGYTFERMVADFGGGVEVERSIVMEKLF